MLKITQNARIFRNPTTPTDKITNKGTAETGAKEGENEACGELEKNKKMDKTNFDVADGV